MAKEISQKPNQSIDLQGVRVHNLKNINVSIPRNQLVVITGLSGSGKSSLAFDTLFAEGQRRYVESLSAYARQFLGRINKPEVDAIIGIPPAIAIEQKVKTRNPRSTVGTSSEIYDYFKLLFARIGRTFSPISGQEVRAHSINDVVQYIIQQPPKTRFLLLAPIGLPPNINFVEKLTLLVQQGFNRICLKQADTWTTLSIEEYLSATPQSNSITTTSEAFLLIDRFSVSTEQDVLNNFSDSIQTAFNQGDGKILLAKYPIENDEKGLPLGQNFSNRFEADGINFEQPTEHLFSFNSPFGACTCCQGYGKITGIDENLVVPDKTKSVYDNAIQCWKGEQMSFYKSEFIKHSASVNFPIHKPYNELSKEQRDFLWKGNGTFGGLNAFFAELETYRYKIQYRVILARYTGKTICPECNGLRLRKEALYVKINEKNIAELVNLSIEKLSIFIQNLQLTNYEQSIAGRTLTEIQNRLQFMQNVGLGYLTLDRLSNTLSGGESQRINLATSLGSNLVGSLYILDEPSIGLHPRDTQQLINILKMLRDLGNTIVVVEHDEEIMRAADQIIDVGPKAGQMGGEIVYQGNFCNSKNDTANEKSLTLRYLNGKEQIALPQQYRKLKNYIEIVGAQENNLKNINVKIPLDGIVAITGVSGSGKSTLVKSILYPALNKLFNLYGNRPGLHAKISGSFKHLKNVEMIDQNPIGRSSRSNPVTYIKAYDEIRRLFSEQHYAKINGYTPSHFSFNIAGGRCEECQGDGTIHIEMQFMADVTLECEACHGKRFKSDILEVKYHTYNISDILDFTVSQAITFFEQQTDATAKKIAERLMPLEKVGLGYIKLGQSSSTLSGGESQRVKLASFLSKESSHAPLLFIFDEPTTGLHFHDIKKLLTAFNALVDKGHSVLVVEHNMDVVKCADWVIDLGPEGGTNGGKLCFEGTPIELSKKLDLYTGKSLSEKLTEYSIK
ncbi:MAG: excinuclease ABC subunit UvrA [Bacteroidales bacterium]